MLCLHLLAKPKPTQKGFTINISDKQLYWIEDYIQQTCRIKNPYLLNIGKSKFLLKTAIEGITAAPIVGASTSEHSGTHWVLTIEICDAH